MEGTAGGCCNTAEAGTGNREEGTGNLRQRERGTGNGNGHPVPSSLSPFPTSRFPSSPFPVPSSQFPQSHWDEAPLALTDGSPQRPKLRAVTAGAAREGVRAGMTLAEARALCGSLEVLSWDDVAIADAIAAATAAFVQASPQVSPVAGSPGTWWIGATGFADSPGGPGERALAGAILSIARRWHPMARVAIAGTCAAARAGTWASGGFARDDRRTSICIVPPGGDATYLHDAPLTLLPMDGEMRDALRALGIRGIGGLADLDAGDVEQRWGDAGLSAWRMARGDDPRRPVLARLDQPPHVELELATPAETMEPVLFLVRPALERLVGQMAAEGRAVASLSVTLTLDDARGTLPTARAHTITREIRLPRALARVAPLFERCRGLLSTWTLSAPVTTVRVTVLLTAPLPGDQGNLLDTSWRDPGAADAALERVRAELGPDVVVRPHVRDGYVPEQSGTWREHDDDARPEPSAGSARPRRFAAGEATAGHCLPLTPALRLLDAPEKVDVDQNPQPRRLYWRGRAFTVLSVVGPERLSGDWWADGYSRDYWRCESEEVGDLMLYRDAAGWWMQGWYD